MDEQFKIYIDQLNDGHTEEIQETLSPEMMDIHEKDLQFKDPIHIKGKAYLATDDMILQLDVHTEATLPCSICNGQVKVPIDIEKLYISEPISEIKSGIYNFKESLRENILVVIPLFAECHNGNCPERETLKSYFKKDDKKKQDDRYHPFANL